MVANQNRQTRSQAYPLTDFQDSMVELVRALGLTRPDTTPCGQPMSVGEAQALSDIARVPGITQNGLAQRLRLDKSTISRLVGMLARRGWIEQSRDRQDSRLCRLRLTAQGSKIHSSLAKSRRAKFERVLQAIPAKERAAVSASLAALVEAIRAS